MQSPPPSPSNDRYARQTALPMIGAEGQRRLAAATWLVVGCGALGGAQAALAARAGVGSLILADRDVVEIHNLPRQILFDEGDARLRHPKAEATAARLREINSGIRVEAVVADVTPSNVLPLVRRADIILDGTDNHATRLLLNDAAVMEGRPWVYGGVLGARGAAQAFRPGAGPCLRCVFPEPPPPGALPTCETAGVLSSAVLWVASLQFTEALKLTLGTAVEAPPLYSLDIWAGRVAAAATPRRPDCPCCGGRRFEFLARRQA